jgi:hypothetical protein
MPFKVEHRGMRRSMEERSVAAIVAAVHNLWGVAIRPRKSGKTRAPNPPRDREVARSDGGGSGRVQRPWSRAPSTIC